MLSNHMNAKDTTTALDELHSHLTPTQFSYLLSVLALSSSSASASQTKITETGASSSKRSFSPDDSTSDSDVPPRGRGRDDSEKSFSFGSDSLGITTSIMLDKRWRIDDKIEMKKPDLVGGMMLQLPVRKFSMESTVKSTAAPWNESRRVSMLAVKSCASHEDENEWSVGKNVQLAQNTYSKVPLPAVKLQGETFKPERSRSRSRSITVEPSSCSELPICKKIMGRYAICTMSRSSSTESVYAESLPDPDNPLVEIAGKIANEPINPFPILRMPPKQKKREKIRDIRIESEIDHELRKFEDFREVSDFFSKGDPSSRKSKSGTTSNKKPNYSRRVTNPLYKEYDPSGYHKSEDELALECIQHICNDFNLWTRSLVTVTETKSGGADNNMHVQDANEIQPDFLVQILRKDLEHPEPEQNENE